MTIYLFIAIETKYFGQKILKFILQTDDEDTKPPKLSFLKVMRLNAPEWKSITLGSLTTVIHGFAWPILAIVIGNFVGVS